MSVAAGGVIVSSAPFELSPLATGVAASDERGAVGTALAGPFLIGAPEILDAPACITYGQPGFSQERIAYRVKCCRGDQRTSHLITRKVAQVSVYYQIQTWPVMAHTLDIDAVRQALESRSSRRSRL